MPGANLLRWAVTLLLVVLALVVQVTVLPPLTPDAVGQGVVPDVCLLVVVACALVRGPEQAAVLGFAAGVLLDLAPPADHVAGRWALALVIVGYVAGRMRLGNGTGGQGAKLTATAVVATVAASSFVGTSIYAISGLLLRDPVVSVGHLLPVILAGVAWDVLLTPLVLPALMRLFTMLEPGGAHG
jgi:rod shape-determining protein MreD